MSITAAGTKTFKSFLPATGTSATFTALDDADGASAGEEPDAGDVGWATVVWAMLDPLSCVPATVPELAAMARPISESRFNRCKSVRMSAACW
jgi:hypothetical protein